MLPIAAVRRPTEVRDHEDPEGMVQLIADAIRLAYDDPGAFAGQPGTSCSPVRARQGAGLELLDWFLYLANDLGKERWMDEARAHVDQAARMKP